MRKLLIVESPAKAKTISKYLKDMPDEYDVVASVGHVRDLPKSNKKAIDVAAGFVPHYEISKGKEKVVSDIESRAKKADEILLATDPDREGEAIAWHLSELIEHKDKKSAKKIKRVTYHEITKDAIQDALGHPRAIDEDLRRAQEARRVLDRLVGYDLSGLIWKKVRYGLSAGRVQSPALRIIMEREREIRAFISHPYWIVTADVSTSTRVTLAPGGGKGNPCQFTLTCDEELTDKARVDHILEAAPKSTWTVKDIKETEVKKSPRAPFITSTLQQAASTRLGFAPSRTMGLAQKLYEAGLITYMRTDSTTLSKQALGQIAGVVEKDFGKDYLQFHTFSAKSKNAQEAHEAIRPTNIAVKRAGKNTDEEKLYNLIWRRTIASQMKDANTLRTKILVEVTPLNVRGVEPQAGGVIPDFAVNGSRVLFDGWMKADPASRGEDVEVPKVSVGEKLNFHEIHSEEKQTEPPGRYSEAGLIKELEKRGIGRPSTYASIIKTIEERGYVEKVNKALVPTDTGDVVSSFLENNFPEYISDTFTAEMEDELDDIAAGKREYEKTLKDFYTPFVKELKEKDKLAKATDLGAADDKFKCPVCGSSMIIKLGKNGKFLSCSRYPDCEGALTLDGHEIKKDEPIGIDPETNLPIFVNFGKYGPYVQLGEYVKTKTKKGEKKAKPRMASIPKEKDLSSVTVADALKYLSLPRVLGNDPKTGVPISASIGRFGPYIVRDGDFRSLKTDDVYAITLERALEILSEAKKVGRGRFAKKKKAE